MAMRSRNNALGLKISSSLLDRLCQVHSQHPVGFIVLHHELLGGRPSFEFSAALFLGVALSLGRPHRVYPAAEIVRKHPSGDVVVAHMRRQENHPGITIREFLQVVAALEPGLAIGIANCELTEVIALFESRINEMGGFFRVRKLLSRC